MQIVLNIAQGHLSSLQRDFILHENARNTLNKGQSGS